jgi:hypothetical protein
MDAPQVAQALCKELREEIRRQNISVVSVDDVHDAWVRLRGPSDRMLEILCETEDGFRWRDNPGSTRDGWQVGSPVQSGRHSLFERSEPREQMKHFVMQWLAEQRRHASSA